ncbi:RNA methyltransferase [Fulvivirga sp. M361]|uniref:TrmH family RNA methyltransferase n=1 Tax=Fulvivirga sp. M361 TaxID=2594266 RepID=UPI00117B8A2F|nr:RNA methyltransferase [Fulvivirga sp. M361]TRX59442.1 RNA methyltransferase [Fulvivirga sp. M361]
MCGDQSGFFEFLSQYVTEGKKQAIERVLEHRTRYLTVVLEDVYHSQNTSAVVRSCDCFGIQDLHVIENKHHYELNPRVVHGASQWVDVIQYMEEEHNSETCFSTLREKGYQLVGTVPDPMAPNIHDFQFEQPTALVFGTEKEGLSDMGKKYCDKLVTIPMYGFTESFNISVSAALSINLLARKLFSSNLHWRLSENEKQTLRLKWFKRIVRNSDIMEKEFFGSGKYL